MSEVYGSGAVMGMSPSEVDKTSMWKFMAAAEGFAKANDPGSRNELSSSEAEELWDWMKTKH